ncbi:MAG: ATP-dependent protease LonB [Promethearchaeota archaeon]
MDEKAFSEELDIDFETTKDLPVSRLLIDQVIGQDRGVSVIRKAAAKKRNVLLIGPPGTGKSLLGQAMSQLIPKEQMEDILAIPNRKDPNTPKIVVVPAGSGEQIVLFHLQRANKSKGLRNFISIVLPAVIMILAFMTGQWLMGIFVALVAFLIINQVKIRSEQLVPKLLVDNSRKEYAPFLEATGAHAGAMLGDVRHDPFQSGGLGTPAHERVEAGLIHKAHKGVLFIDEIATLKLRTQHDLLTAMQEKKFQITGQSELSSGAMVRTEPVPCDFILIAAGNLDTVQKMHPALRSRIRGYGYEVYINETLPDTLENRRAYAQFVAQEVRKDGKIPHFTKEAVIEIIREGRRRAGRKGHLTLMLRDLGGLIRAAGDLASEQGAINVTAEHIINAKTMARSLEQQIGDKYIERKREYEVIRVQGEIVGRVNGLAIIGDPRIGASGIVLPLEAEVVPALSSDEGRIIATGKLGDIAKEAVQNVSALIKKHSDDVSKYDIHIQFLQTHEGVEGDSASISVATAVFSSIRGIPVDQSIAMTGSLSVRGDVLPIGGVTPKIEAACEAGLKKVLIPVANKKDVILEAKYKDRIEIVTVSRIEEVLQHALVFDSEEAMEFLKIVGSTNVITDEKKKFSIDFNQPVTS